ncbi:energy transducer TonB, partial [Bacteroides acidifaciens]
EDVIHEHVEIMPDFPGGMAALMKYLGTNIKYPTISQEMGSAGKVIVQFVVDKDGTITNPAVVRGVDAYLDKEAIRVISSMPKWKPGVQNGKKVRVKYTVPVVFRLQ